MNKHFDLLEIQPKQRNSALHHELQFEAGIYNLSWLQLSTKSRAREVRHDRRKTWKPFEEISPASMYKRIIATPPAPSRALSLDWINYSDETPHALLIRWTKFTKPEIEEALSRWISSRWKEENKKQISRKGNPLTALEELVAYRLRKEKIKVHEVASMFRSYTGRAQGDSWVRKAVRKTRARLKLMNRALMVAPLKGVNTG